jgi:iduronate 2-sulfatase
MTGRRPNSTRIWDLDTHFRSTIPNAITLPQHFKNNGYHTQCIGKIFHDGAKAQDALSWSVPEILAETKKEGKYVLPINLGTKTPKAAAAEITDVPDNAYVDGQVAEQALDVLGKIKNKPFFLAIGFRRPHLPFSAPKKYWDMYQREKIPLPIPGNSPANIPAYALHKSEELRGYKDLGAEPISAEKQRELIHGYYASISYTDAQIGKVLAALDRLGLTNNTIIVLWSDHGFHLGEKGLWAKTTNYELDTRVPLIIAAPGKKKGVRSDALVELVDLYPTLAGLSGLQSPDSLEGVSMAPLLTKPDLPWKSAAFSQFPRPWIYKGDEPRVMGYAIRTERYRYVEWRNFGTNEVEATELYDNQTDPREINNIVNAPGNSALVNELKQKLSAGWQKALPMKPNDR